MVRPAPLLISPTFWSVPELKLRTETAVAPPMAELFMSRVAPLSVNVPEADGPLVTCEIPPVTLIVPPVKLRTAVAIPDPVLVPVFVAMEMLANVAVPPPMLSVAETPLALLTLFLFAMLTVATLSVPWSNENVAVVLRVP